MIATAKLLTTTFVTMKATAPKSKESCFLFLTNSGSSVTIFSAKDRASFVIPSPPPTTFALFCCCSFVFFFISVIREDKSFIRVSCFLFRKKYVKMPLISPAAAAAPNNENWKARLCCSKKSSISSPWLRKKPRIAAPTATKTKLPVKNEPASLTRNSRLLRRSNHLSELSTIELRLDCISCRWLESFSVLFISQDHPIFCHGRKNYRDFYLRETC